MKNLATRIQEDGIEMDIVYLGREADDEGWQHDAWRVYLRLAPRMHREVRTLAVPYKMGIGLEGRPPKTSEVLSSLLTDARQIQGHDGFEHWASEFGYTDSRKSEKLYQACVLQSLELGRFLGSDFYAYLNETDWEWN